MKNERADLRAYINQDRNNSRAGRLRRKLEERGEAPSGGDHSMLLPLIAASVLAKAARSKKGQS